MKVAGLLTYFLGLFEVPFNTSGSLVYTAELFLLLKASRRTSTGKDAVNFIWNLQDSFASSEPALNNTNDGMAEVLVA